MGLKTKTMQAFPKADQAAQFNACFQDVMSLLIRAIQRNDGDYKTAVVSVYDLAEVLIDDYGDGEVKDWLRSLRDGVISMSFRP
jgi:hypothetical protein